MSGASTHEAGGPVTGFSSGGDEIQNSEGGESSHKGDAQDSSKPLTYDEKRGALTLGGILLGGWLLGGLLAPKRSSVGREVA